MRIAEYALRTSVKPAACGFFVVWLHGGYTVQNHVLMATWWLHEPKIEKVHYFLNSRLSKPSLVGRHGLEPWTKGL